VFVVTVARSGRGDDDPGIR